MDLSIEEFQRLADDKSLQAMRIADLKRMLAETKNENEQLKSKVKQLEMANAAERLKNMLLTNYITLSVEKIKTFVSHLKGLDRFAFLKTFLEYVLPAEHYQEQLLLVNEVMVIPEEPKQPIGDTHNHYVTMTGSSASYTENNNTPDPTNHDN
jgi:hypothetical protein